ncbi:MAG TPA: DUF5723 family protein [Bacteroidia bacterium]|nr:DUF5723 family protein [Bacteroidia bacterium]HNT80130.1 DUF5723 family protein [Bacteroidia bacterium]
MVSSLCGQAMWGIANSNYAGQMGFNLNPASIMSLPWGYEINYLSGNFHLDNNYLYYPKGTSLLFPSKLGNPEDERNGVRDYYNSEDKKGFMKMWLKLPGLAMRRNMDAFGIRWGIKALLSVRDLNYHLAKFEWEGFDFKEQHDILYNTDPYTEVSMYFGEVNLDYGRLIRQTKEEFISAGVSGSFLYGFGGNYIHGNHMDYILPRKDTLIVYDVDAEYGHALANLGGEDVQFGDHFKNRGLGGSISIGAQYFKRKDESAYVAQTAARRKKYTWRAGASLIDLGVISFTKDAAVFSFSDNQTVWPGIDTVALNSIDYADSLLSVQFYGDPNSSYRKDNFLLFLPASLSLQFDYCIKPAWYVNASIIKRIPFTRFMVSRPDQISITPRYEVYDFEVALPYSFYDYDKHRIGLAFRYKWLIIGSDKIGAFTGLWDITGFDFYFGIRFTGREFNKRQSNRLDECFR